MKLKFTILALALLGFVGCTSEPTNLREAIEAVRPDFEFGAFYCVDMNHAEDRAQNDSLINAEFHSITLWSGMISMWHGEDDWRFESENMDAQYQYGVDNGLKIHVNPLMGPNEYMAPHLQSTSGNIYTKEELLGFMRTYITAVLERYPEADCSYVVNEALKGQNEDGSIQWASDNTPWLGMGWYNDIEGGIPQYMIEAFKIAREVRPDMKLLYNENTNCMVGTPKGDACYDAVKAMREAGVSIDAVGMQMHIRRLEDKFAEGYTYDLDFDAIEEMVAKYEAIGVEVYITEFDVELAEKPTAEDFEAQADLYAKTLVFALENDNIKGFTTWGLSDKYSWVRHWVLGENGEPFNCQPLMYDANYEPKSAYAKMFDAVMAMRK